MAPVEGDEAVWLAARAWSAMFRARLVEKMLGRKPRAPLAADDAGPAFPLAAPAEVTAANDQDHLNGYPPPSSDFEASRTLLRRFIAEELCALGDYEDRERAIATITDRALARLEETPTMGLEA